MEHRLAVWTIAPADRTLQDRLVKELRLAEGSDVEAGSAFLPGFIERHNAKLPTPLPGPTIVIGRN